MGAVLGIYKKIKQHNYSIRVLMPINRDAIVRFC